MRGLRVKFYVGVDRNQTRFVDILFHHLSMRNGSREFIFLFSTIVETCQLLEMHERSVSIAGIRGVFFGTAMGMD